MSINKAAYVGNATPGPGQYDRNGLVALCEQAARNGGAPIDTFDGRVISMNGGVDLFGYVGGMTAFCDSNSLSPSPLGQEMGHGYGLDHARKLGSSADYQDPWDVMSVYDAYMEPNKEWGTVGPGLNAWCMRSRGWLDETRVWTSNDRAFNVQIKLRPLHRRDLPGLLAAGLGPYLIEYRPAQRWDAEFPRSAVFVHSFSDNHSYVQPGISGNFDLVAGDAFQVGDPRWIAGTYMRVDVVSIDDAGLTATLGLQYSQRVFIPPSIVGTIFGGVGVDGGGGIFVGGHFHPIPPWGPENEIAQQLANYIGTQNIADVGLRMRAQRDALDHLVKVAGVRAGQLEPLRSPAPNRGGAGSARQLSRGGPSRNRGKKKR